MERSKIKEIVLACLYLAGDAVSIERLQKAFFEEDVNQDDIKAALGELTAEFGSGSLMIVELAGGYQIRTNPRHGEYLAAFLGKRKPRLSAAAVETLSIVMSKQPVSREEIERLRGLNRPGEKVNCESVLDGLMDKGLIELAARKKKPGGAILYGTTKKFLEYFGMGSIADIPSLTAVEEMEQETKERIDDIRAQQHQIVTVRVGTGEALSAPGKGFGQMIGRADGEDQRPPGDLP